MSTLPPRLEGMDPELQRRLAIAAMDLGLNILADRHEEQFYFPHPQFTDHDRRVGHAIHSSMDNRSLKRFSDVLFDEGCVLSDFEFATQDLQYVVGMMAWTDEDNLDGFKYLAACRGTASEVMLPLALVLPKIHDRARRGVPTRLLAVHNHPRHPLKDFFEDILGNTLGPSGTDRSTTWSWLNIQVESGGLIRPSFVLHERGQFRRIRWPSVETLAALWAQLQRASAAQQVSQ